MKRSCGAPSWHPPYAGEKGMTLIELGVVIFLILVLFALVLPVAGRMLDRGLRESSRKISAVMRFLYREAMATGITYRMGYNLDRHYYFIEASQDEVTLYATPVEKERGEEEEAEYIKSLERGDEGEAGRLFPEFFPAEVMGFSGEALAGGVFFKGVYTPQYEEVITPHERPPEDESEERVVYTHFFPWGFMENTVIYLMDEDGDVYSLVTDPLRGNVKIYPERVDIPEAWLQG